MHMLLSVGAERSCKTDIFKYAERIQIISGEDSDYFGRIAAKACDIDSSNGKQMSLLD